ncbi:MAG: helix-turn-helix domain-containing protein [Lentisphaeria bacterium]|nr:helix-turn-helix domain-containing protein [Lentisphaeria bacterium]MBQ8756153.1 helix-turn-helix domain-containing protein [Lentisphaeria bacterium]
MSEEKENLPLFDEEGELTEVPAMEETPVMEEESVPPQPPSPPPAAKHCSEDFFEGGSFGATLRQMRLQSGRELADISKETHIQLSFLQALEAEDCKNLPQPVYVLGFIRKLCDLYGVPREKADELTSGLREKLEYELPADINKSVVDRDFSEENDRKLRQLTIALAVIALLILGGLTTGTVWLVNTLRNRTQTVQGPTFNPETLLELQEKPRLKVTELQIP